MPFPGARQPPSGLPRLEIAPGKTSASGATASAAPKRVAEAKGAEPSQSAAPNAVIKVVAYSKGKIIGPPWGAKAHWEGPLPQRYTGTRSASGWTWDSPDARTVRIGSDLQGRGGQTLEAWAGAKADRIVVYAAALDAVTDDKHAAPDEHSPGHATDERDAGDGSTSSDKSAGKSPGKDHDRDHATQRSDHMAVGAPEGAGEDEHAPNADASHADFGPRDADEKLADELERQLGMDPNFDDAEDATSATANGSTSRGKGVADGEHHGRAGDDTRLGGTGPGGERARADGDGKGAEGKPGDAGVPSGSGIIGIVGGPAAHRGAVEVAARQRLAAAEMAEEAATVKPVAGRLPQNHELAGKQFPADRLPAKYRAKGVKFTPEGYPDFAPHAKQLPNGKDHVEIEYTGSRSADEVAAHKKAGLLSEVDDHTWHHAEDGKTMYLVPAKLHDAARHTGGTAAYKHTRGLGRYGN